MDRVFSAACVVIRDNAGVGRKRELYQSRTRYGEPEKKSDRVLKASNVADC